MKVTLLPGPTQQRRLFSTRALDQLDELGQLIRNPDDHADLDKLSELAAEAEVLITSWGSPRLELPLLTRLSHLELVLHAAGSIKPIMSGAAWDRGIRVSGSSGPLGVGVAETALGMTIASLKNLWRLGSSISARGWSEQRAGVRELYDVTVGVVGAGRAGSHYIRLLQPFDVRILLADPEVSAEEAARLGAAKVTLDELIASADVVSLHAPSLPQTRHLLNRDRLRAMRDDAILINTARGSLVDEAALVTELESGRLFACLDVTDPEPPAVDNRLRELPNCVLTGHVAGSVSNGLRRIGDHVVRELQRYGAGESMAGEVRRSDLDRLA